MIIFIEGEFSLMQVLEFWMLGTPDPGDCKRFLPKTFLLYAQVP
jgi:hypothetical protein